MTRDGFQLHKELLRPGHYFARTSLASVFARRPSFQIDYGPLSSKFQRAMVERDLKKIFRTFLSTRPLDLLIYDPIDERFNLLVDYKRGEICTLSTEFLSVKCKIPERYEIVRSGSNAHFSLWEQGWVELVTVLKKRHLLHVLRINRVKWATHTLNKTAHCMYNDTGRSGWASALKRLKTLVSRKTEAPNSTAGEDFLPNYSRADVERANQVLDRLYRRMEQDLSPNQFLTFSADVVVGDELHKWGKSPFHYVAEYYRELMDQVLLTLQADHHFNGQGTGLGDFELEADYYMGVITARIVTDKSIVANCKFAFYLLEDGNRRSVRKYSSKNTVEFRLDTTAKKVEVMGFLLKGSNKIIKRIPVNTTS